MNPFGNKIDSLLDSSRLANLIRYSNMAVRGGYISEWGIFRGGSLEILARYNSGVSILAVDSFEGVGEASEHDYHQAGDFGGINARSIIGYFEMVYPSVRIIKGWIPKVFEYFDDKTFFSFSHVDLDMYDAVRHTSDFLFPRTLKGGIILYDDYNVRSTPGATKAIDEFYADKECAFKGELKLYPDGPSHNQYLVVI